MHLKKFKNLLIYLLLFTPLSIGIISCSGNNKSSSKIKEVSSDEDNKQIFLSSKTTDLSGLISKYDGKQQTFNFGFVYKPSKKKVTFPVVLRTRQAGGWGGKSLYVTTSGFKIQ